VLSTDLVVSPNDAARYRAAADTLYRLSQMMSGTEATRSATSFRWVVLATPGKLSDLTKKITTGSNDICGSGHPYTTANVTAWTDAFWSRELLTTGTTLVSGFTVQDALVTYTTAAAGLGFHNNTTGVLQIAPDLGGRKDGTIAIRMP